MSLLTDALNRIRAWLHSNCPAAAESITPGLSLSEIQEITRTLPFSLPHEVYELYQWSRGHAQETQTTYTSIFDPYEGMTLCSLRRGIQILPSFEDELDEIAVRYINKPLFPVFEFDCSYLCVIGDWEDKESSPIIFVSEINDIINRYTSLTSMMLTLAECFETGTFFLDEDKCNNCDKKKFSLIYLKYNFNLLVLSLKRLKQELVTAQQNSEQRQRAVNQFLGDIAWLDRERRNLAIKQLDLKFIEPLITAMQKEDEPIVSLAKQALEDLNYNFEQG